MKCVPPLRAPAIHTWTDMQRVPPSRRARLRAHGILLSHQGFSMSRIAAVSQLDFGHFWSLKKQRQTA